MRLIFLTFYFPPDLCAGSFRAEPLCEALDRHLPPQWSVDIYTTRPNRYQSFSREADAVEKRGRVTIHRVDLPPHASGMADQSRAFAAYARSVVRELGDVSFDAVLATSSRLLTAALGARLARRRGVPLYLDIRDIFVDTMDSLLPKPAALALMPCLKRLEAYTINMASGVNLVSGGFLDYFERRFPGRRFNTIPNGIDDEFLEHVSADEFPPASGRRILYAGNIGMGQGLHRIVPELAQQLPGWTFQLIGDGGASDRIKARIAELGVDNVELIAPVNRKALRDYYARADILFLHLNDVPAFRRVLPSKLFEYSAMGKPVLAGVAGFAGAFVRDEIENAAVFAPCDVDAAVAAIDTLRLEQTARPEFVSRYRRAELMDRLATDIVQCLTAAA